MNLHHSKITILNVALALVGLAVFAAGCSDTSSDCQKDGDCYADEHCISGTCKLVVVVGADSGTTTDTGSNPGPGTTDTGSNPDPGTNDTGSNPDPGTNDTGSTPDTGPGPDACVIPYTDSFWCEDPILNNNRNYSAHLLNPDTPLGCPGSSSNYMDSADPNLEIVLENAMMCPYEDEDWYRINLIGCSPSNYFYFIDIELTPLGESCDPALLTLIGQGTRTCDAGMDCSFGDNGSVTWTIRHELPCCGTAGSYLFAVKAKDFAEDNVGVHMPYRLRVKARYPGLD